MDSRGVEATTDVRYVGESIKIAEHAIAIDENNIGG
jgi:hypothetical protein